MGHARAWHGSGAADRRRGGRGSPAPFTLVWDAGAPRVDAGSSIGSSQRATASAGPRRLRSEIHRPALAEHAAKDLRAARVSDLRAKRVPRREQLRPQIGEHAALAMRGVESCPETLLESREQRHGHRFGVDGAAAESSPSALADDAGPGSSRSSVCIGGRATTNRLSHCGQCTRALPGPRSCSGSR